jgi:hypothetical protein
MAAAISSDTNNGQPSSTFTMLAMPAISSCASAKLSAFTRWAVGPKRRFMNSGTERTLEP